MEELGRTHTSVISVARSVNVNELSFYHCPHRCSTLSVLVSNVCIPPVSPVAIVVEALSGFLKLMTFLFHGRLFILKPFGLP